MDGGYLLKIFMLAQYTPLCYDAKFATGLCSCNFFLVSILCTQIKNWKYSKLCAKNITKDILNSHYIKYMALRRGHQLHVGHHVGYHQLYVVSRRGHQSYGGTVIVTLLQPYSTSI